MNLRHLLKVINTLRPWNSFSTPIKPRWSVMVITRRVVRTWVCELCMSNFIVLWYDMYEFSRDYIDSLVKLKLLLLG